MRQLRVPVLGILVHVAALLPLAVLLWDLAHHQLTANPIQEIQLRTGKYTLVLLVLSLIITPLYSVSRLGQLPPLRRTLGLYSFMYASLHFLNFIGLDYGFNFALIWADIGNKRFILAGFPAFLILLTLAITSTQGWLRRLGKNWKRLHRLVYLAALLAVLHFLWQVKTDPRQPLVFAAIVISLLVIRIPWIKGLVRGRQTP